MIGGAVMLGNTVRRILRGMIEGIIGAGVGGVGCAVVGVIVWFLCFAILMDPWPLDAWAIVFFWIACRGCAAVGFIFGFVIGCSAPAARRYF